MTRQISFESEGFRVVAFSVQHDHLRLVTEACDRVRLSNALRALVSRVACGLNLAMRTRGPRVVDGHTDPRESGQEFGREVRLSS